MSAREISLWQHDRHKTMSVARLPLQGNIAETGLFGVLDQYSRGSLPQVLPVNFELPHLIP
jgi:hypothetical protein